MVIVKLVFILVSLIVMGCQNTPCRNIKAQDSSKPRQASSSQNVPTAGVKSLKVKIYKADGSLQCGMGKKISLDEMQKELKGIQVFSKSNQNDGLMRIQVCGSPTGDANVYEINQEDLEKALKLGFKQWTFN